jgi:hypothetical protein
MIRKAQFTPQNAQVVIVDPKGKIVVPKWTRDAAFVWTDTCIFFGCRPDIEGDTMLTLGDMREVDPGTPPVLQVKLKTPSRKIALESIDIQTILEADVSGQETLVRIWANHPMSPDNVIVGFE